jgi:hypothetical protein
MVSDLVSMMRFQITFVKVTKITFVKVTNSQTIGKENNVTVYERNKKTKSLNRIAPVKAFCLFVSLMRYSALRNR